MNLNIITWNMQGKAEGMQQKLNSIQSEALNNLRKWNLPASTETILCLQEVGSPGANGKEPSNRVFIESDTETITFNGMPCTGKIAWCVYDLNKRCGTAIFRTAGVGGDTEIIPGTEARRPAVTLHTPNFSVYSLHATANVQQSISEVRTFWNTTRLENTRANIIFAGDFNQTPTNAARYANALPHYPATTKNNSPQDGKLFYPGTSTQKGGKVLDFFIGLQNTRLIQAPVCLSHNGLSDHFPVQAVFDL